MKHLAWLVLSMVIASCVSIEKIGWDEWLDPGIWAAPEKSVAVFDWSRYPGIIQSIDEDTSAGLRHKTAKLLPGKHVVKYKYYSAEFGTHPGGIIEIDLKAGHLYELCIKLCFWCKPRTYAVWVDDKTVGEVVWGKRPDWPSWFL